jgi:hypothetical protein
MASNYKNIINKFNSLINNAITEKRKQVFNHMKQNYIAQFFTQLRNFFSSTNKKEIEDAGTLIKQEEKETKEKLNITAPLAILGARANEKKPAPTMGNFKSALDNMFDDFDWLDSKDRTQLKKAFSEEKIAADFEKAGAAKWEMKKIKPSIDKNATPEQKAQEIKDKWLGTFLSKEEKNDFVKRIDTDEAVKDAFHALVSDFEFTQARSPFMKQIMLVQGFKATIDNLPKNKYTSEQIQEISKGLNKRIKKLLDNEYELKNDEVKEQTRSPKPPNS